MAGRNVLVIYVGQESQQNLRVGLQSQTWGFKERRDDYSKVRPGDFIVIGTGLSEGGPRVPAEEWSRKQLKELTIGRVTTPIFEDRAKLWPDENDQISYPYRVKFDPLDQLKNVDLQPGKLSPEIIEGLRLSGTNRGLGYVVPAGGQALESYGNATEIPPAGEASLSRVLQRVLELQPQAKQHPGDAGTRPPHTR